jgi:molybdate transport system substrate-binding protein
VKRGPVMREVAVLSVALFAVALTGCGGDDETPAAGSGSSSAATSVKGTVTVFAAASLQEAFTEIGATFESEHPGTKVVFSFGPSSGLAEQIAQGAPIDVFASASTATMDQVVEGGNAASAAPFVVNTMEIAVPPDNPADVATVDDLTRKGVKVALCQAEVPCGATSQAVFDNAGVKVTPVTQEVDVKAVLSKVRLGEVDAGVVYVTDVRAAGDEVTGVEIPADVNATTTYPIATLTDAPNPAAAKAFAAYVRSADGLAVLTEAGFGQP